MKEAPPKALRTIDNYFKPRVSKSEREENTMRRRSSTKKGGDWPLVDLGGSSPEASTKSTDSKKDNPDRDAVKTLEDDDLRSEREHSVQIIEPTDKKEGNTRKRTLVTTDKDEKVACLGRTSAGCRSLSDENGGTNNASGLRKKRHDVNYDFEDRIDQSLQAHSALLSTRRVRTRHSSKTSIASNDVHSQRDVSAGLSRTESRRKTRNKKARESSSCSIIINNTNVPTVVSPTSPMVKASSSQKSNQVGNGIQDSLGTDITPTNVDQQPDVYVQTQPCSVTQGKTPVASSSSEVIVRQYLTDPVPYNCDSSEFDDWKRTVKQSSHEAGSDGDSNWVESVLDKRIKNGKPQFLVKYMGFHHLAGGRQWWHSADEITGGDRSERNKITDYETREAAIKQFAGYIKKKMGRTNFDLKYPQFKNRKQFSRPNSQTEHSTYVDQLHRKECYINFLLEAHGQKPLYFVNWTNTYELSDPSQFMERPEKWTEESRRSLSFEYLLKVDAPHDILEEIAHKESLETDISLEFKCSCDESGQCLRKCPCVKESKNVLEAKIVGKDIVFNVESEETVFFACGPKCECSDYCHRKIPSWGRQYSMFIFFHENKGWGVHAACDIPKGSFLGMYTGVLERMRPSDDAHYQFLFPTIFSNGDTNVDSNDTSKDDPLEDCLHYLVDSGVAGNEFSLINHSCEDGNVRAFNFLNCNNTVVYEIGFVSTRAIKFGEELTYNYMLAENKKERLDDDDKPDVKCVCRENCPNMVVA